MEDYSDEEMDDEMEEEEVEEEEEDIEESPVKKVTKNGAGKVRPNFNNLAFSGCFSIWIV